MALAKYLKTTCFLAAATTLLIATGCQSDSSSTAKAETDASHSQAEISDTQKLLNTQEAAGWRAECTMYPNQFDGAALSSLGTKSLDMVLADHHSVNPLVIYMAVPDDSTAEERRLAVGRYLEDRGGLKAEQVEFRAGPNPDATHATDQQLTYYPKTDTTVDGGSGYGTAASSAAAGGK